jgi:heavy metal sensor kinase
MRSRTLSIGLKWTLRYAAVMLVTASLFSAYVYERAQRGIDKDAKVLIRLQLDQVLGFVAAHPGDRLAWEVFAARQVAAADPDLRLGVQVFDRYGALVVAVGSAAGAPLVLPADEELRELREVDLGHHYRFLAAAGRGEQAAVQVLVYSRIFARGAARVRDAFVGALPVLLVLTAALGYALSRGSLRPIAAITRTARRISASQIEESIPRTGSGDELDELARTLNDMLARLRDSMERMRQFSVDAAHQLRTPLTAIQSEIEVTLAKERQAAEHRTVLEDLLVQVGTLSETVNGMLRLAQSEGGVDAAHRRRIPIDALLAEVVEFFSALAEEGGLELAVTGEAKASVEGDPVWLHQLFANLIHNALKYTPSGGRVEVEAAAADHEVTVRVRDDGLGMSESDRNVAFARLQRGSASSAGDGMGLGLALAHEIARAHGGSIEVESEEGHGSVFTVRLPRADDGPDELNA